MVTLIPAEFLQKVPHYSACMGLASAKKLRLESL